MSFFKKSTAAEDVKGSSSNYINGSGMYPVTLLAPFLSVSGKGATTMDMYLDHNGQKQTIYGKLSVANIDGSSNKVGAKTINQLLVIADVEDVADPVDMELPIGTGGKDKQAAVFEDLMDIEVIMQVQMSYGIFNENIQENKNIRGFYRASDFASAEEIVAGTKPGVAYEKDLDYASKTIYKDGVTEEQVKEWITNKRPKGTAKSKTTTKETPSFGKKRFNSK